VILKTRDFSLLAIVNVLAFVSTPEITPWNGIALSFAADDSAFSVGEAVAVAVGESAAVGLGEADFLARANPLCVGQRKSNATLIPIVNCDLCFINALVGGGEVRELNELTARAGFSSVINESGKKMQSRLEPVSSERVGKRCGYH
jgi:hypothetical protein